MLDIPHVDEVAQRNRRFDRERLARFEKCEERARVLGAERPRYRVDPPLGEMVTVSGQKLVSVAIR